MLTLTDFPDIVNEGQIPSCEVDGKVHYSRAGYADVHIYTSAVSSHPSISITRDTHQSTHRAPTSEVFLPVNDTLTQRIQNAWYENGVLQVLEVLANSEDHKCGQVIARSFLNSLELLGKLANNVGSTSEKEAEWWERQLKEGVIQLLCWHPHCTKLAVLSRDDAVTIFSAQSHLSPVLKAKTQCSITSLAWRPLSSCELAVCCKEGVYLWHVDPNSVISRPSINCAIHLQALNHVNITTAAWNPQGNLLASGSSSENAIWVWHVDSCSHILLRRLGGHGTRLITWSPDSTKLLTATFSDIFRVWKCGCEWTCEMWRGAGCSIVAASFCPASKCLLFATDSEPFLYCLESTQDTNIFQSKQDKAEVHTIADFTKIELDSGICVGGLVEELCWDEKGRYLAVTFKESPLLALFLTNLTPHFHLVPKFFINGSPEEIPTCIAFENNFTEGANLTIAWSSGRVQYFPIIYKLEDSSHNIVGLNLSSVAGLSQTPTQPLSQTLNQTNTTLNQSHFFSFTSPKSPTTPSHL